MLVKNKTLIINVVKSVKIDKLLMLISNKYYRRCTPGMNGELNTNCVQDHAEINKFAFTIVF